MVLDLPMTTVYGVLILGSRSYVFVMIFSPSFCTPPALPVHVRCNIFQTQGVTKTQNNS